jgi:hypothetical protein
MSVAQVDDKKVKALAGALKEIGKDAAAFRADPKGKVPELDPEAVAVFKSMSPAELQSLLAVDQEMMKAGFTVGSGNLSVRMV